jgi:Ca-activated chloride channel family protein
MAQSHNHSMLYRLVVLVAFLFFSIAGLSQTNNYLLKGNQLYEQQKYKEAEADYSKALQKDPNNTTGLFNLGNSLYQQKLYDSSRKVMATTAGAAKDKSSKAAANYNIGNTYMSQQKWDDAVNAYKQTLRNNPQDADAKYNLSYAEQMMKKQQDKNKQDKKKQNKDQNKDKQKQQNKDQDKQDKGQNDNKDKKDDKDKDQQQPQSQPSKLSQQQADQLLNALQQEEKKLQDKMKKEKGAPVKMEKDW